MTRCKHNTTGIGLCLDCLKWLKEAENKLRVMPDVSGLKLPGDKIELLYDGPEEEFKNIFDLVNKINEIIEKLNQLQDELEKGKK